MSDIIRNQFFADRRILPPRMRGNRAEIETEDCRDESRSSPSLSAQLPVSHPALSAGDANVDETAPTVAAEDDDGSRPPAPGVEATGSRHPHHAGVGGVGTAVITPFFVEDILDPKKFGNTCRDNENLVDRISPAEWELGHYRSDDEQSDVAVTDVGKFYLYNFHHIIYIHLVLLLLALYYIFIVLVILTL